MGAGGWEGVEGCGEGEDWEGWRVDLWGEYESSSEVDVDGAGGAVAC